MSWNKVKWIIEDVCSSITDTVSGGADAVTDFIKENPKTSIALGTIAGIASAGVAAPAIAATIGATGVLGSTVGGTVIASLEGAALTSASLAAIGGGSIATGGTGMAGGAYVVAVTGGLTASTVSSGVVKSIKNTITTEKQHSITTEKQHYITTEKQHYITPSVYIKTEKTLPPRQLDDVINEVLELTVSDKNMAEQTKRSIAYKAWKQGREAKSVLRETNAAKKALYNSLAELDSKRTAENEKKKLELIQKLADKYKNKTPLQLQRLAEHKAWAEELDIKDVLAEMEAEQALIKAANLSSQKYN